MNWGRIGTSLTMKLLMALRRRIVFVLLAVIPVIFLGVVALTTSDRNLPIQLASVEGDTYIQISERGVSFVFFAVASAGFLVAFFALDLVRKNRKANKRLIICGYQPVELIVADISALFFVIISIAVYIAILTQFLQSIDHFGLFIAGLALIGFVYGSYGLVVGTLVRGELEGILMILLLVNIDAGWLQNPLFYAGADHQIIIRLLPAYFPSQVSIMAAFTDYSISTVALKGIAYGLGLVVISMITYYHKMSIKR